MAAPSRSEQFVQTEDGYNLLATTFEPLRTCQHPSTVAVINASAGTSPRAITKVEAYTSAWPSEAIPSSLRLPGVSESRGSDR